MKTFCNFMGEVIGVAGEINFVLLAIELDCTVETIEAAIKAGCKTEKEIREWVKGE